MVNRLFRLFLLLVVSSLSALGQQKLSLSATAMPLLEHTTYSRFSLYPESDGQIVEPILLTGPKNAFGFATGLTGHYTYTPGWSVAAGVWYRQSTTHQDRPASVGGGTVNIRSRAIRIPILLNYQRDTRRLSPYYSIGTLLDFSASSRIVVERTGQSTQHLRLNTASGPVFYLLAGAGARYQFDRHYSLIMQPVWAYNLGRFGGYADYNSAWEVSLQTQVVFKW